MEVFFLIVAFIAGGVLGLFIEHQLHIHGSKRGEVILEYAFDWYPTDATIPVPMQHAQVLDLRCGNTIGLQHKPNGAMRVTVKDDLHEDVVEFYIT